MNKKPLVSVVIPIYNSKSWILETLNSVFEQTYDKFEVIIVDDGSTDKTREILDKYIKKNKIKYFYQKNKGPAAARNLGASKAKGKYIAFLDSDDLWKKEKLQIQVDFLVDNPEYKLVFSNVDVIDEEKKFLFKNKNLVPKHEKKLIKEFFMGNINMNTPTILVDKNTFKKIGGFSEELLHREDHFFLMEIVNRFLFKHMEKSLVKRRIRENSLSTNLSKDLKNPEKRLKYYEPFIKKSINKFDFLKKHEKFVYAKIYKKIAIKYFMMANKKRARFYIIKSIKNNPMNLKIYLLFLFSLTPLDYRKVIKILKSIKN
jgi:glycosyltransferase involved in cell wall biosynthesis